jgi:hypothetical protein
MNATDLRFNNRRLTPDPSLFTFYRITLSALASTFGGIVRPICLAALIDDQLELRRLLYWEIGRLGAFEDLVHILSGASVQVVYAWA